MLEKFGIWGLAFTPIPFKVFTILSGSLNYPLWQLLAYASLGRAVKFYVVGILFFLYGKAAEGMVKEASFAVAAGAVSLIAVFLAIRKLVAVSKKSKPLPAANGNRPEGVRKG